MKHAQNTTTRAIPVRELSARNPRTTALKIMNTVDFSRIISTMIREGVTKSQKRANELIAAFVQWISISTSSGEKPYLMFKGPVDRTFHCFILNTEFYAAFCNQHFGKFINHNPLDAENASSITSRGGIEHTTSLLQQHFGSDLHPELKKWVRRMKMGTLKPSSVSCVRCDY